jgi:transcriptional regulator with XRE-family HTH domain
MPQGPGESAVVDQQTDADVAMAKEFGARLRELRGQLTQHTVARRSVIGQSALTRQRVSNIENGLPPTAEQLRCYLQGCGQLDLFDELDALRRELEPKTGRPMRKRRVLAGRWWYAVLGLAVIIVAAAVATSVTLFGGRDGGAIVVIPECAPDAICFWPEPDFVGAKIQWPPDWQQDGRECLKLPFTARSVMNGSTERQWGYASKDCTGPERTLLQHNNGSERSVVVNSYIKT